MHQCPLDTAREHLEAIRETIARLEAPSAPDEGREEPVPEGPARAPTLEFLQWDWRDFSRAIESIPGGASCGPDGLPAIMLKKANEPISRMLAKIFEKSIKTGEIPRILKSAFVIGIYKGGPKAKAANYRPISLTSHVIKTMERVLRLALVGHLEHSLMMDPRQHGSRAGRSTLSQLLQHQDEILTALENGANLDCIYLDFSKAYDKVDHGILLLKLKRAGITGNIGRWIMNFLVGRRQQVLVRGQKSKISPLVSGVPQGSVLGPLLFLLFIGDIADEVSASTLVYVDDSKVKDEVKSEDDVTKLQENLDKIYEWERSNNMKFNGEKFQLMRYGKDTDLKQNTLYFTGEMAHVIEQVENCRDLGVTMQDDAKFDLHIENVCKKVRQKCGWILRTFYSRNPQFLRHMFNTLVQPHIDYCSQLWAPQEGPQMDKIEALLRSFTARIPAVKHLTYWERLKELKMNSQQRRLERYKIIYVWKTIQGLVPNCGIEVATNSDDRLGRKCQIRPLHKKAPAAVKTLREGSFQVSGPQLFNCLPKELRNQTELSLEEFKEKLDQILTRVPDEPQVSGPGRWISNSLLNQMERREEGPPRAPARRRRGD